MSIFTKTKPILSFSAMPGPRVHVSCRRYLSLVGSAGKSMDATLVIRPLVTEDYTLAHPSYPRMFGAQFSFDFSTSTGLGNDQ